MDRDYIEANHIVECYLAGKLSPEEAEAFQVHVLENPDVADDLAFALALKRNLTKELDAK